MTDDLQTGFLLLIVGMITVFTVLGIVVMTGRAIIYILNNAGKGLEGQLSVSTQPPVARAQADKSEENKKKLTAAITAAFIATKGKGKIRRITRDNQ